MTVGTVVVRISGNRTITSTEYASAAVWTFSDKYFTSESTIAGNEFLVNGTLKQSVPPRTDTNDAGTVTAEAGWGNSVTYVAYPTRWYNVQDYFQWNGSIPITSAGTASCETFAATNESWVSCFTTDRAESWTYSAGATVCETYTGLSPLPSHTAWPDPGTQEVNTQDPQGHWYKLVGAYGSGDGERLVDADFFSQYWPGQPIVSIFEQCNPIMGAAPASAVQAVSFLLATTTINDTPQSPASIPKAVPATTSSMPVPKLGEPSQSPVFSTARTEQPASSLSEPPATALPASTPEASSSSRDIGGVIVGIIPSLSAASPAQSNHQPNSATPPVSVGGSQAPASPNESEPPRTTSQNVSGIIVGLVPSLVSSQNAPSGDSQSVNPAPAQPSNSVNGPIEPVTPAHPAPSSQSNGGAETAAAASSVVPALPALTIGSSVVTPDASSNFVIGSQILRPGGSITVGSGSDTTVVAIQTDGSQTVVLQGSSAFTVPSNTHFFPGPNSAGPAIVVGSSTVTAGSSGEYVVAGQTLKPGSSITAGFGSETTVIALQTDSLQTIVQVGTSYTTLGSRPTIAPVITSPPIVVGDSTITATPTGAYVVSGQTLHPGSHITIGSGAHTTIVALQTSGSQTVLVVGSVSSTVAAATASNVYMIDGTTITAGGEAFLEDGTTYSALPSGSGILVAANGITTTIQPGVAVYTIAGTTLLAGGSVLTIDGTTYSALASGSGVLVAASGTTFTSHAPQPSDGLGGYIYSGLQPSATAGATSSTVVEPYTGSGTRARIDLAFVLVLLALLIYQVRR